MLSVRRLSKVIDRKWWHLNYKRLVVADGSSVKERCYSTAARPAVSNDTVFKEGSVVEGFIVTKVRPIPEFYLDSIQLRHVDTGAEYLHLSRDDSNNAFSIGFRTTPFDSTGVPHILEHLCTCGSEKYPCRDPYFKMLNRSMATFMNAMTGPDYTIYPFSTQNRSDYMNLMSVYLDAVFKPLLRKSDFCQEGWRLEHREVNDPDSPIIFKGVVLNEMKGVFSDNQNIFYEGLMNNMLPSHTYGFISGGHPLEIPNLTYNALKEFHRKHYHPSNAKFYSYGNFPLIDTLKFINEGYLTNYGKVEQKYSDQTYVPLESNWSSEIRKHVECRSDKMSDQEKQSSLAIGHLCCDIQDVRETFVLNVLSDLLVSGPNSSFYKSLVEPNIASGFSPTTGYINQTRTTFFSVALQGLNPKDFDWVTETFNKTVGEIIENGFEEKNIEGVLHNIELATKHQTADFGLGMLFGVTSPWMHDADVVQCMSINENINYFRQCLKENPKFLQDFVAKYFKDNTSRITLSMSPSPDFEEKLNRLEENLLTSKLSSLSEDEIKSVYDEGLLLKRNQEKIEDISSLPSLSVSDLRKDIDKIELIDLHSSRVPVQLSIQPTNGLTYFYGLLGIDHLPEECKNILPLFCYVADKMGSPNFDYRKFDQEVQLTTRGLNFSYHNSESLRNVNEFQEGILISSQCVNRNIEKMFQLWSDIFNIANSSVFDNVERFQTLVSILAANYLNSITHNGHHYAMLSSSSLVSDAAKRKETCGGLTIVKKLQEISRSSEIDKTLNNVKTIASLVFNNGEFKTALNVAPDFKDEVSHHLNSLCSSVNGLNTSSSNNVDSFKSSRNVDYSTSSRRRGIHHVIPMQVNFAAKSVLTVPYVHHDYAALRVLCRLLTMKYCIPEIREKGGAYGAGANISSGGVLSFYSYRDPNPARTHNAFDESHDWVLKNNFTRQDIEEAKLGTFQAVDAPIPPGEKGIQNFLHGLDSDTLQKHRLALMSVSQEDLIVAASKYLDLGKQNDQGRALIGPLNEDVIKRDKEEWTVVE